MSAYSFTTEAQVRAAFWQGSAFKRTRTPKGRDLRQNEYAADVRMEWVDFVDMLARDGHISEALAQRVTL